MNLLLAAKGLPKPKSTNYSTKAVFTDCTVTRSIYMDRYMATMDPGDTLCIEDQNYNTLYVLGDGLIFEDEKGNKVQNAFGSSTRATKITATKYTTISVNPIFTSFEDDGYNQYHVLKKKFEGTIQSSFEFGSGSVPISYSFDDLVYVNSFLHIISGQTTASETGSSSIRFEPIDDSIVLYNNYMGSGEEISQNAFSTYSTQIEAQSYPKERIDFSFKPNTKYHSKCKITAEATDWPSYYPEKTIKLEKGKIYTYTQQDITKLPADIEAEDEAKKKKTITISVSVVVVVVVVAVIIFLVLWFVIFKKPCCCTKNASTSDVQV